MLKRITGFYKRRWKALTTSLCAPLILVVALVISAADSTPVVAEPMISYVHYQDQVGQANDLRNEVYNLQARNAILEGMYDARTQNAIAVEDVSAKYENRLTQLQAEIERAKSNFSAVSRDYSLVSQKYMDLEKSRTDEISALRKSASANLLRLFNYGNEIMATGNITQTEWGSFQKEYKYIVEQTK